MARPSQNRKTYEGNGVKEMKDESEKKESPFAKLNAVNVNDHTEKKNGLTYLSWAWAWAEVKKLFPNATYTVYERDGEHGPINYFTDGRTCWVKTGVTIDGLEYIEELPVMDFRNCSIPLDKVDSMAVNKAIQRSLTKACARHGLGLYIYAGEDLPEQAEEASPSKPEPAPAVKPAEPKPDAAACRKAGKMVWDAFVRMNEGVGKEELKARFTELVRRTTGKGGAELTVDEWQKVAENMAA